MTCIRRLEITKMVMVKYSIESLVKKMVFQTNFWHSIESFTIFKGILLNLYLINSVQLMINHKIRYLLIVKHKIIVYFISLGN